MELKLNEVPITDKQIPFKHCKLEREKYAVVLTKIIETYSTGFVLALNNRWGEGKTTFLKMWRVFLDNQKYETLYFNAWEHDFNRDPLSAILSELKSLEIYDKQQFAPLIKKGAKLSKSLIPVLIGALAEKYIDTKAIKDAFQKLSEQAANIFEEEVNEYADKKKGLEDFKEELKNYVSNVNKRPLIFFIDELDRCNPKYAVELLEIIKHFFSVPGIVFVVSIDKEQLSHSVRGYFGSESLNTEEYLRRFFDLEYSIPKPEIIPVIDWMFEKYSFHEIHNNFSFEEIRMLKTISIEYLRDADISIRFIEKLFLQVRLALGTINQRENIFTELLFILVLIKYFDLELYIKIKDNSLDINEFLKRIRRFIAFNNSVKLEFKLEFMEVRFAYLYSNNFKKTNHEDIIREVQPGKYSLVYEPEFDISDNFSYSIKSINEFQRNYMSRCNLNSLIRKIELLDPLQT